MNTKILDEKNKKYQDIQPGDSVAFKDKEGKVRIGTVRVKEINCGKENCSKCPHKSYRYIQYRVGKKIKDKYIGKQY